MPENLEDAGSVLPALVKWLVFETSPTATTVELLHGFAERLCGAGFDLVRVNLQLRPLSPQAASVLYVWRPAERRMELSPLVHIVGQEQHALDEARVQVISLAHGAFQTSAFRASPFFPLMLGGELELRRQIAPDRTDFDFPILKDLQAQGATDYVAFPLQFYGSAPSAISLVTKKAGGFTSAEISVLREARRPLLLALSPRLEAHTTRTLLGAYISDQRPQLSCSPARSSAATSRKSMPPSGSPTCAASRPCPPGSRRRS